MNVGIAKIKEYTKRSQVKTYYDKLFEIVTDINTILPNINADYKVLGGFKCFFGKYIHKNIKREIYSILHSEKDLHVIKVEYFTDVIEVKDLEECQFGLKKHYLTKSQDKENVVDSQDNSGAEISKEIMQQMEAEELSSLYPKEECRLLDLEQKHENEIMFLNEYIDIMKREKIKVVVNSCEDVQNYSSNFIRYFAYNSIFLIY